MLPVTFERQIFPESCGAAALSMVYGYLRMREVSQVAIYNARKEPEPHGTGAQRVSFGSLAEDVRDRGLYPEPVWWMLPTRQPARSVSRNF